MPTSLNNYTMNYIFNVTIRMYNVFSWYLNPKQVYITGFIFTPFVQNYCSLAENDPVTNQPEADYVLTTQCIKMNTELISQFIFLTK